MICKCVFVSECPPPTNTTHFSPLPLKYPFDPIDFRFRCCGSLFSLSGLRSRRCRLQRRRHYRQHSRPCATTTRRTLLLPRRYLRSLLIYNAYVRSHTRARIRDSSLFDCDVRLYVCVCVLAVFTFQMRAYRGRLFRLAIHLGSSVCVCVRLYPSTRIFTHIFDSRQQGQRAHAAEHWRVDSVCSLTCSRALTAHLENARVHTAQRIRITHKTGRNIPVSQRHPVCLAPPPGAQVNTHNISIRLVILENGQ